mmetsp:Transcript_10078/g.25631  ORF Transcript_10078/g.25631 Transcript_10078/m.25631 type:complete len:255 (-) Transcript_10078:96-860(-)
MGGAPADAPDARDDAPRRRTRRRLLAQVPQRHRVVQDHREGPARTDLHGQAPGPRQDAPQGEPRAHHAGLRLGREGHAPPHPHRRRTLGLFLRGTLPDHPGQTARRLLLLRHVHRRKRGRRPVQPSRRPDPRLRHYRRLRLGARRGYSLRQQAHALPVARQNAPRQVPQVRPPRRETPRPALVLRRGLVASRTSFSSSRPPFFFSPRLVSFSIVRPSAPRRDIGRSRTPRISPPPPVGQATSHPRPAPPPPSLS